MMSYGCYGVLFFTKTFIDYTYINHSLINNEAPHIDSIHKLTDSSNICVSTTTLYYTNLHTPIISNIRIKPKTVLLWSDNNRYIFYMICKSSAAVKTRGVWPNLTLPTSMRYCDSACLSKFLFSHLW